MLSKNEIERYSRQILLIGKQAQIQIKKSRFLVLGAGGIGSALLPYLAASGVGYVRLLDPDVVEMSNLSRQILYSSSDITALKGPLASEVMQKINPEMEIDWRPGKFTRENSELILNDIDLVLEGTDDIDCKFLVSDLAVRKGYPAIIGSIGNVQGHIFPVAGKVDHACYRCLFENPPQTGEIPTCATEGILSPLPGIIGSMMAYIALDFILKKSFAKKVYLMEQGGWRTISLSQNKNCTFCSENSAPKD